MAAGGVALCWPGDARRLSALRRAAAARTRTSARTAGRRSRFRRVRAPGRDGGVRRPGGLDRARGAPGSGAVPRRDRRVPRDGDRRDRVGSAASRKASSATPCWACSGCRRRTTTTPSAGSARPSAVRDRAERLGARAGPADRDARADRRQHRVGGDRHRHRPQHRDRRRGEHRRAAAAGGRARRDPRRRHDGAAGGRRGGVRRSRAGAGEGLRGRPGRVAGRRRPRAREGGPIDHPLRRPPARAGAALGASTRGGQSRGARTLVTLLGEPGIGKSRVVEEFLADLPDGGQGPERPVEPVRGGGHVLAARPDGVSRAGRAARRAPRRRCVRPAPRAGRLAEVDPDEVERSVRRLGFALGLGGDGDEDDRYHAAEVRRGMLSCSSRASPRTVRWCSCSRTSSRRTPAAGPDRAAREGGPARSR